MAESIGGNRTRRSDKYAQQAADALQILSGLKGNSETLEISADNAKAKAIMEDTEKAAKKMRKNVEEPIEINISDDDVFNSRDIQKRVKDITDSLRNAAESIQNGGKLSQKETEGFVKQYYELGKYLEKVGQEVPEQISQAYQKITNSLRNRNADIFKGKWAINENPDLEQFYKRINEKTSNGDLSYRAQGEAEYRKVWGSATRTINRELSQEIENAQINEAMEQLDRLEERAKQVGSAVQAIFTAGISSDASDEYLQEKIDQLEQYLEEINEISDEINNLQISSKNKTLTSRRDELKNQLSSARGIDYNVSDNINSIIAERREAEAKAIEEQEQRIRDAQNSIEALIRNHEDFADYGKESWVQKYKDKLKEDGADLTSVYNEFVAEITEAKRTAQEALSKQQARDSRRTEIEDFFSQISGGDPDKLKEYMKKYVSEMNQIINDASQSIAEFKDRVAKELGLSYGGSGGIGGTNGSGGTNTMTDEPQEFEEQSEREEEAWKKAEQKWESVEEVRKRIISQHRNRKFEDDNDYNHYLTYDSSFSNDYDYKKDEYEYVDKLIDDAKQEENRLEELNRVLDKLQEKREGIQDSIRSAEDGGYGYDIQHLDDKQWGEPEYVKGELSVLEDYYKQLLEIDDLISYVQDQKSQAAINFKPGDAWGTQEIQVLIQLLQELVTQVKNVTNAFGMVDEESGITTLLSQMKTLGDVVSGAFNVDKLKQFESTIADISDQLAKMYSSIGPDIKNRIPDQNTLASTLVGTTRNDGATSGNVLNENIRQAENKVIKRYEDAYDTTLGYVQGLGYNLDNIISSYLNKFNLVDDPNELKNYYSKTTISQIPKFEDRVGRIIQFIKMIDSIADDLMLPHEIEGAKLDRSKEIEEASSNIKKLKQRTSRLFAKRNKLMAEDSEGYTWSDEYRSTTAEIERNTQEITELEKMVWYHKMFPKAYKEFLPYLREGKYGKRPSLDIKDANALIAREAGLVKDTRKAARIKEQEAAEAPVIEITNLQTLYDKLNESISSLQSTLKSGLGLESIEGEEGKFTSFLSQIIEKMGQLEKAAKEMANALSGAMKEITLSDGETKLGKQIQDAIDSGKPYQVDVEISEQSMLADQIKKSINSEAYKIEVETPKPVKQKTEREHEVIRPTSDGGMVRHSIKTSTGEQQETQGSTTAINASGEAAESADTSVKRLKKDIEGLGSTKPVNPLEEIADSGASLSNRIQEAINEGNPYQIEVKPQTTLLDAIQSMLDGKEFQIKAGVSGTGSGESPAELITQMVGADLLTKVAGGNLRERAMMFNSKTGYHTNPFMVGNEHNVSTSMNKVIMDSVTETVDTYMHTHPALFPGFSIAQNVGGKLEGDYKAMYQLYKEKGIKTQINAAQNGVAIFDAEKFFGKYGNLFEDGQIDNTMQLLSNTYDEAIKNVTESAKKLSDVFRNIDGFNVPLDKMLESNSFADGKSTGFKELISKVWKNASGNFDSNEFTQGLFQYIDSLPSDYNKTFSQAIRDFLKKSFSDFGIDQAEIKSYIEDSDFTKSFKDVQSAWMTNILSATQFAPKILQQIAPEVFKKALNIDDFSSYINYQSIDEFKRNSNIFSGRTDPYNGIANSASSATSAKNDFTNANKEAEASVGPTVGALEKESIEFNDVADAAKNAADTKDQFVNANKNAAVSEKDTGLENLTQDIVSTTEEERNMGQAGQEAAQQMSDGASKAISSFEELRNIILEIINLGNGDFSKLADFGLDANAIKKFYDNYLAAIKLSNEEKAYKLATKFTNGEVPLGVTKEQLIQSINAMREGNQGITHDLSVEQYIKQSIGQFGKGSNIVATPFKNIHDLASRMDNPINAESFTHLVTMVQDVDAFAQTLYDYASGIIDKAQATEQIIQNTKLNIKPNEKRLSQAEKALQNYEKAVKALTKAKADLDFKDSDDPLLKEKFDEAKESAIEARKEVKNYAKVIDEDFVKDKQKYKTRFDKAFTSELDPRKSAVYQSAKRSAEIKQQKENDRKIDRENERLAKERKRQMEKDQREQEKQQAKDTRTSYNADIKAIKNMNEDADAAKKAMSDLYKMKKNKKISDVEYESALGIYKTKKQDFKETDLKKQIDDQMKIIENAEKLKTRLNQAEAAEARGKSAGEDVAKLKEEVAAAGEAADTAKEKIDNLLKSSGNKKILGEDAVKDIQEKAETKLARSKKGSVSSVKALDNARTAAQTKEVKRQLSAYEQAQKEYFNLYSQSLSRSLTSGEADKMKAAGRTMVELEKQWNAEKAKGISLSEKQEQISQSITSNAQKTKGGDEDFSKNQLKQIAINKEAFDLYNNIQSKIAKMSNQSGWRAAGWDDEVKKLQGQLEAVGKPQDIFDEAGLDEYRRSLQEVFKSYQEISKSSDWQPVAKDWQAKARNNLQSWMNSNKKAAQAYKEELKELEVTIDSIEGKGGAEEWNAKFQSIQQDALTKGLTGKTLGDRFKEQFSNTMTSLATYYLSFQDFIRYGREAISIVTELDTQLTEMRKVSNESLSSLKNYQLETFDIANQVGTTAAQIQSSTADWLRLGKELPEAKQMAALSTKLLNVSEFTDIKDATDALVSATQAYQEVTANDIVDKLNIIGNNYAVSTDELAQGLQNAGAVLKTQGNDLDKTLALLTAGNLIGQDMSKASAGIRTISLRIAGTEEAKNEVQEMGEDIDDFVVRTKSKTDSIIRHYTAVASNMYKGVSVLDANGNLRDTYDILLDIAEVYEEIQKEDKKFGTNRAQALVEALAGKNRSNIASSILLNGDILRQVRETSMNDYVNSADEELSKYLDSVAGKTQQLKNQIQELAAVTFDSEGLKDIIDALTAILSLVTDISGAFGGLQMALGAMATFGFNKLGSGILTYDKATGSMGGVVANMANGISKLFGNEFTKKDVYKDGKGIGALINAVRIPTDFKIDQKDYQLFETLYKQNSGQIDWGIFGTMGSGHNNVSETFSTWIDGLDEVQKKTMDIATAQNEYRMYAAQTAGQITSIGSSLGSIGGKIISGISSKVLSIGAALGGWLIVTVAITAALKGIDYIYNNIIKRHENIIKQGKEAASTIQDAQKKYKSLNDTIRGTQTDKGIEDRLSDILGNGGKIDTKTNKNISLTNEKYQEYLDICNQLSDIATSLVSGYDSQGNAIINIGNNADEAREKLEKFMEAQQNSLHVTQEENANTAIKGILEELGDAPKKLQDAQDVLKSVSETGVDKIFTINEDSIVIQPGFYEQASDIAGAFSEALVLNLVSGFNPGEEIKYMMPQKQIDDLTDDEKNRIMASLSERGIQFDFDSLFAIDTSDAKLKDDIETYGNQISTSMQQVVGEIKDTINNDANFKALPEEIQNVLNTAMDSISYEDVKYIEDGDYIGWAKKNLLNPIYTLFNDGTVNNDQLAKNARKSLTEAYKMLTDGGESSAKEYIDVIGDNLEVVNAYINKKFGEGSEKSNAIINAISSMFGFDDKTAHQYFKGQENVLKTYAHTMGKEYWSDLYEVFRSGILESDDFSFDMFSSLMDAVTNEGETRKISAIIKDLMNGVKDNLEIEPVTLASYFEGEESAANEAVDSFQQKISALTSAYDKLNTEGLNFTDKLDLQQQFTALTGVTENWGQALANLQLDQAKTGINSLNETIKDLTDPEQIRLFNEMKQNLLSTLNLDAYDLSNQEWFASQFYKNLSSNVANQREGQMVDKTAAELLQRYSGDELAMDAMLRLSLDKSMINASLAEWIAAIEAMKIKLKIDVDTQDMKDLQNDLSNLQTEAQKLSDDQNYKISIGVELDEDDYGALIKNMQSQIEKYEGQNNIIQKKLDNPEEYEIEKDSEAYKSLEQEKATNEQNIRNAEQQILEWSQEIEKLPMTALQNAMNDIQRQRQDLQNQLDSTVSAGGYLTSADYKKLNDFNEQEMANLGQQLAEKESKAYWRSLERAMETGDVSLIGKPSEEEEAEINELKNQMFQIGQDSAENLRKGFEADLGRFTRPIEKFDKEISAIQDSMSRDDLLGIDASAKDYESLISLGESKIDILEQERAFIEANMDNPQAIGYANTDQLQSRINEINSSILTAKNSTIEWAQALATLPLTLATKANEKLEIGKARQQRAREQKKRETGYNDYEDFTPEINTMKKETENLENAKSAMQEDLRKNMALVATGTIDQVNESRKILNESRKILDSAFNDIDQADQKIFENENETYDERWEAVQEHMRQYEDGLQDIQKAGEKISAEQSLKVAAGIELNEDDYTDSIDNQKAQISQLYDTIAEYNKFLSNGKWNAPERKIMEDAIKDAEAQIIELKQSILESTQAIMDLPMTALENRRNEVARKIQEKQSSMDSLTSAGGYLTSEDYKELNKLEQQDVNIMGTELGLLYGKSFVNSIGRAVLSKDYSLVGQFTEQEKQDISDKKSDMETAGETMSQNLRSGFEADLAEYSRTAEKINAQISKKQKEIDSKGILGIEADESDYNDLIQINDAYIDSLEAQKRFLQGSKDNYLELDFANSDEIQNQIEQLSTTIIDAKNNTVEWNQALNALDVSRIEREQANISRALDAEQRKRDKALLSGGTVSGEDWDETLNLDEQAIGKAVEKVVETRRKAIKDGIVSNQDLEDINDAENAVITSIQQMTEDRASKRQAEIKPYLDDLSDLQSEALQYENAITKAENKRQKVSKKLYDGLIKNGKKQVKILNDQKRKLKEQQRSAGLTQDELADLQSQIDEVDSSILSMESNLIGWQDTMNGLIISNAQALSSAITQAMSEMDSATGITIETMKELEAQFSNLEGHDLSTLFYRTTEGMDINIDRMKEFTELEYEMANRQLTSEIERLEGKMIGLSPNTLEWETYASQLTAVRNEQTRLYAEYQSQMESMSQYSLLTQAESTENQGSRYDAMYGKKDTYKEMAKKGLVGTDDFKEFAKYLDYYGTDSLERFQENWKKFERYYTENPITGLDNFVTDLSNIGMATFDEEAGGWVINLNSAEDAAKSFGISVDMVNDLMGKMEEYGGARAVVTSMEEASLATDELNEELYEAQMKLTDLKADGADSDVIDYQQGEVDRIKGEIETVDELTDRFVEKSEEEREQEFRSLKDRLADYREYYKDAMDRGDIEGAQKILETAQNAVDEFGLELTPELELTADSWSTYWQTLKGKMKEQGTIEAPIPQFDTEDTERMEAYTSSLGKVQEFYEKDKTAAQGYFDVLKNYSRDELEAIELHDGHYNVAMHDAEDALEALADESGLTQEQLSSLFDVLEAIGALKVKPELDLSNLRSMSIKEQEGMQQLLERQEHGDFDRYRIDLGADITQMDQEQLEKRLGSLEYIAKRKVEIDPELNPEQFAAIQKLIEQTKFQIQIEAALSKDSETTYEDLMSMDDEKLNVWIKENYDGNDPSGFKEYIKSLQENGEVPVTVRVDDSQINKLISGISEALGGIQELRNEADEPIIFQTQVPQTPPAPDFTLPLASNTLPTQMDYKPTVFLQTENIPGQIAEVKDQVEGANPEMKIIGDNSDAMDSADEAESYAAGKKPVMHIIGDNSAARTSADSAVSYIEQLNPQLDVGAKTTTMVSDINTALTNNTFTVNVRANVTGLPSGNTNPGGHADEGTGGWRGTAHYFGSSYANGNWGLKSNEKDALVGELGQELVALPNGTYTTVGDNGAELVNLPKNSIIFNHRQTEGILKNRHINSRGKALANGTVIGPAHADIQRATYGPRNALTGESLSHAPSTSTQNGWNAAVNNYTKTLNKGSKNAGEASNKATEAFDFVAIKMQRFADAVEEITSRIQDFYSYTKNLKNIGEAIKTLRDQYKVDIKASQTYAEKAQSILDKGFTTSDGKVGKVDKGYAKAIREGKFEIKDFKTDTDQAKADLEALKAYQDYYEKAKDAAKASGDAERQIYEMTIQKMDTIADRFDKEIDARNRMISRIESGISADEARGRVVGTTGKQIAQDQKTFSSIIQKTLKQQRGGNVDLLSRPQVDAKTMAKAGWKDFEKSKGTATVYSSTFSNYNKGDKNVKAKDRVAMNFTPILPDGSVMEPGKFEEYCEKVVKGIQEDDLGLKIGATFTGEKAIEKADKAAKQIHKTQEKLYMDYKVPGPTFTDESGYTNPNSKDAKKRRKQETKAYEQMYRQEQGNYFSKIAEGEVLQKQLNDAVNNGDIEQYGPAWYELYDRIQECGEAAAESQEKMAGYRDTIKSLKFDDLVDAEEAIKNNIDKQQGKIDLKQSKGKTIGTKDYQKLIDLTGSDTKNLRSQIKEAEKMRASADVGTEEWKKWNDIIVKNNQQIQDNEKSVAEWNKTIMDINFSKLTNQQDRIQENIGRRQDSIALKEATGQKVSDKDYQYLISQNNKSTENLNRQMIEARENMAQFDPNTDDWKKWHDILIQNEKQIKENEKSTAEYNETLAQMKIEDLQAKLGKLQNSAETRQKKMDIKAARGGDDYVASAKDYKALDTNMSEQSKNIKEQIQILTEQRNTYEKGSKKWREYNQQIQQNEQTLLDNEKAQIEWRKAIVNLPFENAAKRTEKLSRALQILQSKLEVATSAAGKTRIIKEQQQNARQTLKTAQNARTDTITNRNKDTDEYALAAAEEMGLKNVKIKNGKLIKKNATKSEQKKIDQINKNRNTLLAGGNISLNGLDKNGKAFAAADRANYANTEGIDKATENAEDAFWEFVKNTGSYAEQLAQIPIDEAAKKAEKAASEISLLGKQLDNLVGVSANKRSNLIKKQIEQVQEENRANQQAAKDTAKNLKKSVNALDEKNDPFYKSLGKNITKEQKEVIRNAVNNGEEIDFSEFAEKLTDKQIETIQKYNADLNANNDAQKLAKESKQDTIAQVRDLSQQLAQIPIDVREKHLDEINKREELAQARYNTVESPAARKKYLDQRAQNAEDIQKEYLDAKNVAKNYLNETKTAVLSGLEDSGLTDKQKESITKKISKGLEVDTSNIDPNSDLFAFLEEYNAAIETNKTATHDADMAVEEYQGTMQEITKLRFDNIVEWYDALKGIAKAKLNLDQSQQELLRARGKSEYGTAMENNLKQQQQDIRENQERSRQSIADIKAEFNITDEDMKKLKDVDLSKYKKGETFGGFDAEEAMNFFDRASAVQQILGLQAEIKDDEVAFIQLQDTIDNMSLLELQGQMDRLQNGAYAFDENMRLVDKDGKSLSKNFVPSADALSDAMDMMSIRGRDVTVAMGQISRNYDKQITNSKAQVSNLEEQNVILREQMKGLEIGSEKYEEKAKQIWANTDAIREEQKRQEELNNAMLHLPLDKLEKELELLQSIAQLHKSQIDLIQATGEDLNLSNYNTQIKDNNKQIAKTEEQLAKTKEYWDLAEASADGVYDGKSVAEWKKEWEGLGVSINNLKADNEALKDSLRNDIYFRNFERGKEAVDNFRGALQTLANLINDDMAFEDNGQLTDFGLVRAQTSISELESYNQSIEIALAERQRIMDLYFQNIENEGYSELEYKEDLAKAEKDLQDAISGTYQARQQIIDLAKTQATKELESIRKVVNATKEALSKRKEFYDYDKQLKNQKKSVQALESELRAIDGITDAETRAQRARLEAQLETEKQNLEDMVQEHVFQLQTDNLDRLVTSLEEKQEKYFTDLSRDLELQHTVITTATESIDRAGKIIDKATNNLLHNINPNIEVDLVGLNADSNKSSFDIAGTEHFASGTGRAEIKKAQWAWTQEKGGEIIRLKDGSILTPLQPGDVVFSAQQSEQLLSNIRQTGINSINGAMHRMSVPSVTSTNNIGGNVTIGSIFNIEGNVDRNVMVDINALGQQLMSNNNFKRNMAAYASKQVASDLRKSGR